MRKIVAVAMLCGAVLAANAVPARRGWQTRTQADGSTVEVQLLGDEYYHYLVNRDGQQVREVNGMYEVVGETPAPAKVQARRAKARRAPKEFGKTPNLAPKGVVILVNFSNRSMASGHTLATFNELFNAENCTVNNGYPSAREYFKSQSNGAYSPQFDVFGPVKLSKSYSYYGNNVGYGDNSEDEFATDAVIEACILANQQYSSLNFADYDSDKDGKVDFVYVVYAGYGEADGGDENTIWPHNWSIQELVTQYSESTAYSKSQTRLDGVYLDNYAMSNELNSYNDVLCGIGTLCHEFGHVMGLPDFYETNYGSNYQNALTPNDWDVMDGGAYNGNGHCPPNYSPWEKYFFGWHTPLNLGSDGQNLTLYANGTENYQAYQINASGKQQGATATGVCYYIENRQLQGWDEGLPSHGMLIWKVSYNATAWANNAPNNDGTSGSPLYTLVSASGTKIGTYQNSSHTAYVYDGPKNPYPGSANVTSKTLITGKPLKNIKESNQLITLTYIEEPVIPVDPFDVTFMSNGTQWATTQSTGKLVMPAAPACECKEFVGWTKTKDYASATTAPTLAAAGDAVAEGATFYAVFAEKNENAKPAVEDELTLATTGVSGTNYAVWSGKQASSDAVYAGHSAGGNDAIQLRSKNSTSGIVTTASGGTLSKVVVAWNTNTTADRVLDIYGKNTAYTAASDLYGDNKGTKLGSLAMGSTTLEINGNYEYIGFRSNNGAVYLDKITVLWQGTGAAYSNYTTAYTCTQTDVEAVRQTKTPEPKTRKVIENGQVLILRDGVRYNLLGQPVR